MFYFRSLFTFQIIKKGSKLYYLSTVMYIGVQWCESWDILAPNPVIVAD